MGARRADPAANLVVGRSYTRDDIDHALGGSKQTYLPTVDGRVRGLRWP